MAWKIELDPAAERELDKLDPPVAKRILKFLYRRVAALDDPRSIGDALKGSRLGDLWVSLNKRHKSPIGIHTAKRRGKYIFTY